MTGRTDIPRLAGSLAVLGTALEQHGQSAWDVTAGWQWGPRRAPQRGEIGGGGGDSAAADRAAEDKMRARAAEHHAELRADLTALDALVQSVLRKVDIACPPNPEEMKNRRTGDFEPWTPAEVALAGWCSSCWRHEQTFTAIYVDPKGMRRWKDSCSWCGPIRAAHKVDPPLDLLAKHHSGRNISEAEFNEAIIKAKQSVVPKSKKGRKAKRKAVAA